MKIHEYQGKELLRRYGVPVPTGVPALSVDDAFAAIPRVQQEAGTDVVVVKAQIHAGGRGKGGGVKLAGSTAEAEEKARAILGMQLVTPQTGPEGQKVQKVLEEREFRSVDLAEILRLVQLSDGLERTRNLAGRYAGRAIQLLEEFPASIYRDAMLSIPEFILNRTA